MNKILILNIIYTSVLLLIIRDIYRLTMRDRMNRYFDLKLKILRLDYLEATKTGMFKEYPLIEKKILNTLILIKTGDFDLRKVKIAKNKKIRKSEIDLITTSWDIISYLYERGSCKSKKVLKIENDIQSVKDEIIRYRYPMRIRTDPMSEFVEVLL